MIFEWKQFSVFDDSRADKEIFKNLEALVLDSKLFCA